MNWSFLNGLLAFAVTMIVLSTVVAAILEFAHQIRRKRERYMRAYLLGFFDTQILPMFYEQIGELAHKSLADRVTKAPTGIAKLLESSGTKWISGLIEHRAAQGVILLLGLLIFVNYLAHPIIGALIVFGAVWLLVQRAQNKSLAKPVDLNALGLAAVFEQKGYDLERLNRFRQVFVEDIAKIRSDLGAGDKYVTQIKPTEFAEALGRSNMGQMLAETGQDRIDALVTDLLRRFDITGSSSIAEFRNQSRTWSIWIAFATAFALNINAITLLQAYFADEDLAAQVAALYSEEELREMSGVMDRVVTREYAALEADQQALEAAREEIDDKLAEIEVLQSDQGGDAEAISGRQADIADLEEEVARLRDKINNTIDALTDVGVPIGWRYFPFCVSDGELPAEKCAGTRRYMEYHANAAEDDRDDLPGWQAFFVEPWYVAENHALAALGWYRDRSEGLTFWFFGVVLAGALIGLGGPFWFDFYRRLSALTNVARNFGISAPKSASTPETEEAKAPPADPETDHRPKTAVDAFRDAVAARSLVIPPASPRHLLNDDGTLLQAGKEEE